MSPELYQLFQQPSPVSVQPQATAVAPKDPVLLPKVQVGGYT